MLSKIKNEKYTKSFLTTRSTEEALFSLDYNIVIKQDENDVCYFIESEIKISYIYLKSEDGYIMYTHEQPTFWRAKANPQSQHCSITSYLEIANTYISLGIGSFVLSELMRTISRYASKCSLRVTLSTYDEVNENSLRRDTMYKNIGFDVHDNYIYTEKISNLVLHRKFDYIEELDLAKKFRDINQEFNEQQHIIKNLRNSIEHYREENFALDRFKRRCLKGVGVLVLMAFLIYPFISK